MENLPEENRFFRQKFQKMENLASKTVFSGKNSKKWKICPRKTEKSSVKIYRTTSA